MQDPTSNIDSEDQNILEIESTDTFDNSIDNDPIEIKDNILSVVDNNTQDFNSPVDLNDHNSSMETQAEIRATDFGPNLHSQVSECAEINAISSNNLTCFNCRFPDHLVKDCPEPNKMQQPQSNNRQNNSKESAI